MILEIKRYGDPILKKKAEEVKEITLEIKELILNMKEMVAKDKNAAGLAAPQIGASKRIFVVATPQGPEVFINPVVIESSKEQEILEEGCLSLPNIFIKVKRPKELKLIAKDENLQDIEVSAKGIMARVLQHETDHINGILFIDRINFLRKIFELLKYRFRR